MFISPRLVLGASAVAFSIVSTASADAPEVVVVTATGIQQDLAKADQTIDPPVESRLYERTDRRLRRRARQVSQTSGKPTLAQLDIGIRERGPHHRMGQRSIVDARRNLARSAAKRRGRTWPMVCWTTIWAVSARLSAQAMIRSIRRIPIMPMSNRSPKEQQESNVREIARRLTGALSIEQFNAEVREQKLSHFRAALTAEEAAVVYDPHRLDAALAGAVIPPHFIDIYTGGQLVKLADVQNKSGQSGSALITSYLRQSATLRVRELQMFDAGIAALAQSVQRAFGARSQVNLYLAPPASTGFPPHFDTTDVFILQCLGTKSWTVSQQYADQQPLPLMDTHWEPARYQPYGEGEKFVLDAGDVLYLPRGVMHAAACLSQPSLHLTISLSPLTVADVMIGEVKRMARSDVRLRQRATWTPQGDTTELRAAIRSHFLDLAATADAQNAIDAEREVVYDSGESRADAGALIACLAELEQKKPPPG